MSVTSAGSSGGGGVNGMVDQLREGSADGSDIEITPMDQYTTQLDERKLECSIRWLISKVYSGNVPDVLTNPFFRDAQNVLHLRVQTLYALNSAELYCAAAARIFHDNSFLNQNHGSVIQALLRCGIDVVDHDGTRVTETVLGQDSPPKLHCHLAVIDALMTAHVRQIITVDRAVQAVKQYTTVDAREEPLDCEDAVLFWVNKICSAVRDQVEKLSPSKRADQLPVIPEMEDLYEDMCDGACLATLLAFYRPQQLKLKEICFNDQMGIADCVYNLGLVKTVCERPSALLFNCFPFRLEDMLYMHEYLQKNVLAFLADLFQIFETSNVQPQSPIANPNVARGSIGSNTSGGSQTRRYEPVAPIPNLRTNGQQLHNTAFPIQLQQQRGGRGGAPIGQSQAASVMNSVDSLMTNRADSIKYRTYRGANTMGGAVKKSPTTTFGDLQSANRRQSAQPMENQNGQEALGATPSRVMSQSQYSRSDSMPSGKAGIRLELEEKRRKYDTQRLHLMNQMSEARERLAKDAFFTLLGKQPSAVEKLVSPTHSDQLPARKPRAVSESVPAATPSNGGLPNSRALHELNQNMEMLKQQIQRLSTDQERLSQMVVDGEQDRRRSQQNLPHAVSQPSVFMLQQPPPTNAAGVSPYAMPVLFNNNYDKTMMAPPAIDVSYGQSASPAYVSGQQQASPYGQTDGQTFRLNGATPAGNQGGMQYGTPSAAPVDGSSTFRLHKDNEAPSRLDPPLELNRNLTNWGMTYRAGARPQRKTWNEQQFAQSQGDLVRYPPDSLPLTPTSQAAGSPATPPHRPPPSALSPVTPAPIIPSHQLAANATPLQRSSESPVGSMSSATGQQPVSVKAKSAEPSAAAGFVIGDSVAVKMSWDQEQRREQLLAASMRRREAGDKRRQEEERKAADKRQIEQRRQEDQEAKRAERDAKRQKVFEEYQRKKAAEQDSGSVDESAPTSSSSPSNSARDGRVVRGKSQPPPRPKSQLVPSASMRAANRGAGGSSERIDQFSATTPTASLAEPTVKPFVKPRQKSNRNIIVNALQYSVFAGAVHDQAKRAVLDELAKSENKHFLLLFRDRKCQYRGLYSWDEVSDTAHKICGTGPKFATEAMMEIMFKYDSGGKQFSNIPTKHLSATIDAFALKDQYWQKAKIPFSGAARR